MGWDMRAERGTAGHRGSPGVVAASGSGVGRALKGDQRVVQWGAPGGRSGSALEGMSNLVEP
jgi:hypothetical protein